jgi:5-methylcytosine-specific restriction endonuclease McrA
LDSFPLPRPEWAGAGWLGGTSNRGTTKVHTHLDSCPALVLNADYRPLSYFPLSLWSWQEAIKAVFLNRVDIVSEYDQVIRSPSFEMKVPSVIVLKEYVQPKPRPAFTRFNVFLRDKWTCQYCAERFRTHELTFDHVIPRSRGGTTTWENICTACQTCNMLKGNYLPHECRMYPIRKPMQPSTTELQVNGRAYPPNFLHESWNDYLYWDTELDSGI